MAGEGRSASATITRPADVTAYTANDVIGESTAVTAAIEFAGVVAPGRHHFITGVDLEIQAAALITSEAGYTLELYSATPPSAHADNEAYDLESGDRATHLCSIAIGTPVDKGATLKVHKNDIKVPVTAGASRSLFGYLVTDAGYTPTASRVYKVSLHTRAL